VKQKTTSLYIRCCLFLLFGFCSNEAGAMLYTQLSHQFDLNVEIRVNRTGNPDLDSTYLRIQIINKVSKSVVQTIRKPRHWIFPDLYKDSNNSRSYSTNFNSGKTVVDDDF